MPTSNSTPDTTQPARGRLWAALGLTGLFVAVGAAHLATGAGAEPVDNTIGAGCTLGASHVDITVEQNVDDKQDPITEGNQETLETKTGAPSIPIEVTINKIVVTTPVPEQIASVDSVTFSGGNVTGTYVVNGSDVVVTFTGPVSSKDIQIPTVTTVDTLESGIGPTTISWKTFSQLVADTNYGTATCTPNDLNQVVNTTKVTSSASATTVDPSPTTAPTTGGPGTTSPSSPPTTAPTTTSSRPGSPKPGPRGGTPQVPSLPGVPVPAPPVPVPPTPPLPTGCVPVPPVPSVPAPVPVPVPGPATTPCPTVPPAPSGGSAGADVGIDVSVGVRVTL